MSSTMGDNLSVRWGLSLIPAVGTLALTLILDQSCTPCAHLQAPLLELASVMTVKTNMAA